MGVKEVIRRAVWFSTSFPQAAVDGKTACFIRG
jgi:hypothetical protein